MPATNGRGNVGNNLSNEEINFKNTNSCKCDAEKLRATIEYLKKQNEKLKFHVKHLN